MPDLVASDVTYTLVKQDVAGGRGQRKNTVDVTFGDGALTYPSGGVPLTKGNLGMPNTVETFYFTEPDADDGFLYKYDASAETVRIYQGDNNNASDAPLIELVAASATPADTTLRVTVEGY